jgi:quercetin dioxygenase-like cupin family protein
MKIKNFLNAELKDLEHCHDGTGVLKYVDLFENEAFATNIRFFHHTVLPAGTSIGEHTHGNDEELYIILEGKGIMTVDGEVREVHAGDVIVNKPFGTHGLQNDSGEELKILVIEVCK